MWTSNIARVTLYMSLSWCRTQRSIFQACGLMTNDGVIDDNFVVVAVSVNVNDFQRKATPQWYIRSSCQTLSGQQ
jgi:hypothetical protein